MISLVWSQINKAWDWIKARWKWVLAGLAILISILYEIFKSKPVVLPPVDIEQKKVEQETDQKEQQAAQVMDAQVVKLEQEHATVIQQLNDDQKKKYDELKANPDELSSWLIEVGKKNQS